MILAILALVTTPAHAYKAGDTLRYVGTSGSDPCAIEFKIGKFEKGINVTAKEEIIEGLKLYTTFDSDHHFSNAPDQFDTPMIIDLGRNFLGVPRFTYVDNHSSPDGFTTDFWDKDVALYGSSLDKLGSVVADYSDGTSFHARTKGKFGCGRLKPASEADFRVAVDEVKTLSGRQIEKFHAKEVLKRQQEEMAESQRKAADEAREAREAAEAKAKQEQWERDAPARQAELDRERAAAGLSPIEHDGSL